MRQGACGTTVYFARQLLPHSTSVSVTLMHTGGEVRRTLLRVGLANSCALHLSTAGGKGCVHVVDDGAGKLGRAFEMGHLHSEFFLC